jgi:hypothetical protein
MTQYVVYVEYRGIGQQAARDFTSVQAADAWADWMQSWATVKEVRVLRRW